MPNLFRIYALVILLTSSLFCAQNTSAQNDNNTTSSVGVEKVDLKILSWNICMLDERFFIFSGQKQRASLITALLTKEDYDVIVFQEAFNSNSREIIADGLSEKYPYQIGPLNNKNGLFKTNSGVWILSSVPLTTLKEIEYRDCAGFDCYAHKGAIMLEGIKDGHAFQIIGTHLQAFDGEKRENIRIKQYQQIRDELLLPFERNDVPQFVCGDFNTIKKSKRYVPMLEILNADDGPLNTSITYAERNRKTNAKNEACTYATNDYQADTSDNTTLDYILCRQKPTKHKTKLHINRRARAFRTPWLLRGKRRKDLSDHYAVEATISWDKSNSIELPKTETDAPVNPEMNRAK